MEQENGLTQAEGMNIDHTVFLTRHCDVELPEGTRTERFRSVHIRRDRTSEGVLHIGLSDLAEDACEAAASFEEAR
jgi:hypothetical protein